MVREQKHKLGFCAYVRVSTIKQNVENQRTLIENYLQNHPEIEIKDWFVDDGISAIAERQKYTEMLNAIGMGMYDGMIVMKLDRIGRSIIQLCRDIDFIKEHTTRCVFILDNLDTSTPEGKLFFHIKASFAEYELNLIKERTKIGMMNARIRGTKSGKPIGHPKKKIKDEEIKRLYIDENMGCFKISKLTGLSQGGVYKRLKKMNVPMRECSIF